MKTEIKSNIFAEFIPIILSFVYLSYPIEMFSFFNSTLGRLLLIFIIIFYSAIDKTIGLLVCGLVILFYQLDEFTFNDFQLDLDMETFLTSSNNSNYNSAEPTAKYVIVEPPPTSLPATPYDKAKTEFRDKYCENGILKFKNMPVNLQMVEHIFPEIEFHKIVCNPCKTDCTYSIIESKLIVEEKMRPVNTTL